MKIGYVRVSKQEQHEALQIDALKEAGCEKWFLDKMTGSKAERKGFDEALAYVREGGYPGGVEVGSGRTLIDPPD
jgi:DNA invertase Pin-like site-specific DNA recombinase